MTKDSELFPLFRSLWHDIQNSLGVITSGLELIQESSDNPKAQEKYIALIQKATLKLSETSRLLIRTNSLESDKKETLNLNSILEDVCTLTDFELKKRFITIKKNLTEPLNLLGNSATLFQALLHTTVLIGQTLEKKDTLSITTKKNQKNALIIFESPIPFNALYASKKSLFENIEKIISTHNGQVEIKKNQLIIHLPLLEIWDT